ncbi:MAG: hypothetical protein IPJ88_17905 [Myxococcales bacterium]|nr:MAG: hypothetical protein IPJ88_17905 [Myxococcales bacterium]
MQFTPYERVFIDRSRGREVKGVVLQIHEAGVYRVSMAEVAAISGWDESSLQQAMLNGQLSIRDAEKNIPWARLDDASFAFVAEESTSIYSKMHSYLLELGEGEVLTERSVELASVSTISSAQVSRHFEEDRFAATAASTNPEQDFWFHSAISATFSGFPSTEYNFDVRGMQSQEQAELDVEVFGAWALSDELSQDIRVLLNGHELGVFRIDSLGSLLLKNTVPANVLREGHNTLRLEAIAGSPGSGGIYFDSFDLRFRRMLQTEQQALRFEASSDDIASVRVDQDGALLFDPAARVLYRASGQEQQSFDVAVTANKEYWLVSPTALPTPALRAMYSNDLRTNTSGAAFVIVSTQQGWEAAQQLAEYRRQGGLSSLVVDIQDVFDEFANGLASPYALKSFLGYAQTHWTQSPRYLLLLGHGSLDYREVTSEGAGWIPPKLVSTAKGLFASDLWFADLSGDDGMPELSVGRLPARSSNEAIQMVERVLAYEKSPIAWLNDALLLAGSARQADFLAQSQSVIDVLSPNFFAELIDANEAPAETVTETLVSELNAGAFWFNYLGHGSMSHLDDQQLLRLDNVDDLTNVDALPIVTAMSCTVGRFEIPQLESLAESLVRQRDGGAIAVWSPSGLNLSEPGAKLAQDLGDILLNHSYQGRRLGDVIQELITRNMADPYTQQNLQSYILFGDPTLAINNAHLPEASQLEHDETSKSSGSTLRSLTQQEQNSSFRAQGCGVHAPTSSQSSWSIMLACVLFFIVRRRR